MFNKGASLIYAVIIISILLGISLGVSKILISQVVMLSEIDYSINAFYAADSGIEKVLMDRLDPQPSQGIVGEATYSVIVVNGGEENCDVSLSYCIKSIGVYQKVRRAVEINY